MAGNAGACTPCAVHEFCGGFFPRMMCLDCRCAHGEVVRAILRMVLRTFVLVPLPVAGESRGIFGLREVSESILCCTSLVSNSLNSSVGVDMSACARAACALPAAAAPRSCSTVARLSDAVVAHAHCLTHALCTQLRWHWWPLACAEVHQLLPEKFVVGHGWGTGVPRAQEGQRWGFRSASCLRVIKKKSFIKNTFIKNTLNQKPLSSQIPLKGDRTKHAWCQKTT